MALLERLISRKNQEPLAWLWQLLRERTQIPKGYLSISPQECWGMAVEATLVEFSRLVQEKKIKIKRV